MKTAVVYYSLEGNTDFVAQAISESVGAELIRLYPKKDIPREGFMRYLSGGKQVFKKEKPELEPLSENPEDYDVLFVGTPVWAGSFAPALASFFADVNLSGKKIALFTCHRGGPGKAAQRMREALKGNEIIGETEFVGDPLRNNSEEGREKAIQWAQEVTQNL